MKILSALLATAVVLASCAQTKHALKDDSTFLLHTVSTDISYGYTEHNPIKVGGSSGGEGPANERRFLNALAGPKGETIRYQRLGSCCPFSSSNGFMGQGLLDKYEVLWEGQSAPVIIYINMYDAEALQAPAGMTIRR